MRCYGNINILNELNSTFYIVDAQGPAVLGLPSFEQLKLMTLYCTVKGRNTNHHRVNHQDVPQMPVRTKINKLKNPSRFTRSLWWNCFHKICETILQLKCATTTGPRTNGELFYHQNGKWQPATVIKNVCNLYPTLSISQTNLPREREGGRKSHSQTSSF